MYITMVGDGFIIKLGVALARLPAHSTSSRWLCLQPGLGLAIEVAGLETFIGTALIVVPVWGARRFVLARRVSLG